MDLHVFMGDLVTVSEENGVPKQMDGIRVELL
jgi:hypothetical protein